MASGKLFRTALADNSSTAKEELGAVRREYDSTNGFRVFKYVQASLTVAASNGRVLSWYNAAGTVATDDISTTRPSLPAGVAIGAITHAYYGWLQIGGYHSAIDTDGHDDVADGDTLIVQDSIDGVSGRVAFGTASTFKILGVATVDDVNADDTVAGLIDCTYGEIIQ